VTTIPLSLLAVHFVADFVFQSDAMATKKSREWQWLTLHVLVYTATFAVWLWTLPAPGWNGVLFLAATFGTHFVTDAITSRITSRLWFFRQIDTAGHSPPSFWFEVIPGRRHWFFVMIGADQLIHATTLAYTAKWWLS
jgi:hypothetical protein